MLLEHAWITTWQSCQGQHFIKILVAQMYIKQLLPGEYNHCEANLNKVRVWNKSDENFKRTGQREQHQDS